MQISKDFDPFVVKYKMKTNPIAAFWKLIVCMIYMPAVLIELLTLEQPEYKG